MVVKIGITVCGRVLSSMLLWRCVATMLAATAHIVPVIVYSAVLTVVKATVEIADRCRCLSTCRDDGIADYDDNA